MQIFRKIWAAMPRIIVVWVIMTSRQVENSAGSFPTDCFKVDVVYG